MAMTNAQKVDRLNELVQRAEISYVLAKRLAARAGTTTPVRHKCFISYHGADIDAVTDFVETFNDVFIPRVIGASDSDHFKDPVNSNDEEYIKARIGSKYLSDSTVTILFVGLCAYARRYIDWELSSSLRNDPVNRRNGLLAITPSERSHNKLPDRFRDNYAKDGNCYARYYYYPTSSSALRAWIEDAYRARQSRANLIKNSRPLRKANSPC